VKVGLRPAVTACAGAVALAGAGTALFAGYAAGHAQAEDQAVGVPYTCVDAAAGTPTSTETGEATESPSEGVGPQTVTASPTPVTRTFQVTLVGPTSAVTAGQGVEVTWRVDPGETPVALQETIDPGVLTMRGNLRWVEYPPATETPTPTPATTSPSPTGTDGSSPSSTDQQSQSPQQTESPTPTPDGDTPTPTATLSPAASGSTTGPLPALSPLSPPPMTAQATPPAAMIVEIQAGDFTLEASPAPSPTGTDPATPAAEQTTGGSGTDGNATADGESGPASGETATADSGPGTVTSPDTGENTAGGDGDTTGQSETPATPDLVIPVHDGVARLACTPATSATPAAIRITVVASPPSSSSSPGDDSPSPTSPTPTDTTPAPTDSPTSPTPTGTFTRTHYATVTVPAPPRPTRTEYVTETAQVQVTPKGWARTGAATEYGPAAGLLILGGAALLLGSAAAGAYLRGRASAHGGGSRDR